LTKENRNAEDAGVTGQVSGIKNAGSRIFAPKMGSGLNTMGKSPWESRGFDRSRRRTKEVSGRP